MVYVSPDGRRKHTSRPPSNTLMPPVPLRIEFFVAYDSAWSPSRALTSATPAGPSRVLWAARTARSNCTEDGLQEKATTNTVNRPPKPRSTSCRVQSKDGGPSDMTLEDFISKLGTQMAFHLVLVEIDTSDPSGACEGLSRMHHGKVAV